MNTVFVPTDFTKSSNGGITLGAIIAEKTNSALTIHHNVMTHLNWHAQDRDERLKHPQVLGATVEAEQLIGRLVKDAFPANLVVNELITHGITAKEIVDSARKLNASVIVMGSHGVEDAGRTFIGSTVQKVLRSATVPVILAKEGVNTSLPRKILFPFQFNEDIRKPFEQIQRLAVRFGATIHLLFVNTPAKFMNSGAIRSEMEAFAAGYPDQDFALDVYNHQDVVTGILEHAKNIKADLISFVSHDRVRQPQYLIGITESVAFHSELPVLSANSRMYKPGLRDEPHDEPLVSEQKS